MSGREKPHPTGCITPRPTIALVQRAIPPEAPDPSLPPRHSCFLPSPCRLGCLPYILEGLGAQEEGMEDLFFSLIFLNA